MQMSCYKLCIKEVICLRVSECAYVASIYLHLQSHICKPQSKSAVHRVNALVMLILVTP